MTPTTRSPLIRKASATMTPVAERELGRVPDEEVPPEPPERLDAADEERRHVVALCPGTAAGSFVFMNAV